MSLTLKKILPKLFIVILIISSSLFLLIYYKYFNHYYTYNAFNNNIDLKFLKNNKYILTGHIMGTYLCAGDIKKRFYNNELNISMKYNLLCFNENNSDFSIVIEESRHFENVTYGENRIPIKQIKDSKGD